MLEPNVQFVCDVVKPLVRKYNDFGLESLSAPERVVFLTWCTHGDLTNGGLRYFYEGKLPVAEVAGAFEELGFKEAAEALRGSLAFFPPEVVAEGSEKMLAWMISLWGDDEDEEADDPLERVTKFFAPFEDVILELESAYGEGGRLSSKLVEHIRAHADEFEIPLNDFPDPNRPPVKPLRFPNRRAMLG